MKININPEEFGIFTLIYLLDKINNREDIAPFDENFEEVIDKLKNFRANLTQFYLKTDTKHRIKYKFIRPVFIEHDSKRSYTININNDYNKDIVIEEEDNTRKDKIYETKNLVKKVIYKIKKFKFYKSRPITEEVLDKIIENTIKGEE